MEKVVRQRIPLTLHRIISSGLRSRYHFDITFIIMSLLLHLDICRYVCIYVYMDICIYVYVCLNEHIE